MKKMLLYILVGILACIGAILLIGLSLPAQRTFTRTHVFKSPVEKVFEMVTNVEGQASWRSDLKAVQLNSPEAGKERWTEILKNQPPIQFQSTAKILNQRFEMKLKGQGFTGHWVGEFEPSPNQGTRVSFTETTTVNHPFARVFAYLFVDLNKSIERYIQDLAKALE